MSAPETFVPKAVYDALQTRFEAATAALDVQQSQISELQTDLTDMEGKHEQMSKAHADAEARRAAFEVRVSLAEESERAALAALAAERGMGRSADPEILSAVSDIKAAVTDLAVVARAEKQSSIPVVMPAPTAPSDYDVEIKRTEDGTMKSLVLRANVGTRQ